MKKKMVVLLGIFFLAVMTVGYAHAAPSGKVYNLKFSYHTPPKASLVGPTSTPGPRRLNRHQADVSR